jgi:hypothetical protein
MDAHQPGGLTTRWTFMSGNARPAGDGDTLLEAFAAKVTGAAYPIAAESRAQDVLDVVFSGILSDAAQAASGSRVPSAMLSSAASEAPPPR